MGDEGEEQGVEEGRIARVTQHHSTPKESDTHDQRRLPPVLPIRKATHRLDHLWPGIRHLARPARSRLCLCGRLAGADSGSPSRTRCCAILFRTAVDRATRCRSMCRRG